MTSPNKAFIRWLALSSAWSTWDSPIPSTNNSAPRGNTSKGIAAPVQASLARVELKIDNHLKISQGGFNVWIEEVRIENYKCFHQEQVVKLKTGINLIVGKNSSGKSALLDALGMKFEGEPHRSKHSLPRSFSVINPRSRVRVRIGATGEEVRHHLLVHGGRQYLPWPREVAVNHHDILPALDRVLAEARLSFRFTMLRSPKARQVVSEQYPVLDSYNSALESNAQALMMCVEANASRDGFVPVGAAQTALSNETSVGIAEQLCERIYRYEAQRFNVDTSSYGSSSILASDASNLPEVLNHLQNNDPTRFARYLAAVQRVLPDIHNLRTPATNPNNYVQIRLWLTGTPEEREDLALSLRQCGTGVGQVLAILYVVIQSRTPRCILIDEPSSFLHPDAARSLMQVISNHPQHQYIISTHSPEVISACTGATVTLVRWGDGRSQIRQFDSHSVEKSFHALSEVGARLSDLFGYDRVVWVEGPSDAECWKLLDAKLGPSSPRTAYIPVRDTSAFRTKELSRTLDLHRKLSFSDAWLPPTTGFIFDREGRSNSDIADLVRESKGLLRFLPRRMLENWLLQGDAVACLIEHFTNKVVELSGDQVKKSLTRFGVTDDPDDPSLVAEIDGARVLSELIGELTSQKLMYRKVEHAPWLFEWLLTHKPSQLASLIQFFSDSLGLAAPNEGRPKFEVT